MAEGGDLTIPQLKRRLIVVHRCGSEIHEVHCSQTEFIPKGNRGVACQTHGTCAPEEHVVKTLSTSILGRCMGRSALVINTMCVTPVRSRSRDEFPIVSDKDL